MNRKRNIFIGCTKKERPLAEKAKAILSEDFEVTIWDDPIWEVKTASIKLNDNILQGLLRVSLQFDFALMIGTKDDKVEKKGETVLQARDNVLFELGLFIGRIGKRNCAFIVERGLNILADLQGIVISKFERGNEDSFNEEIKRINETFLRQKEWSVNFFPSATLAAAYFESLILPTYKHLTESCGLELNEERYTNWQFKIIIPSSLSSDLNTSFQTYKNKRALQELTINVPGRVRKLSLETDIQKGIPTIVDFPTILSGINHSIKHLIPEAYNHANDEYKHILERELQRFQNALVDYAKREGNDLFKRIQFQKIND